MTEQPLSGRFPDGQLSSRTPASRGRSSYVVFGLIGLNVAVWLWLTWSGGESSEWADRFAVRLAGYCQVSSDPSQYFPGVLEEQCRAASDGQWVAGVNEGAYWQVLTSAFTHLEPVHLLSNMFVLFVLGPTLENALGQARFLLLYLVSALGGSAAVLWLGQPQVPTVGASGAVFGVMAALFVVARRMEANTSSLLLMLGINVAASFQAGVSWQGHFGGLISGAMATICLVSLPRTRLATGSLGVLMAVLVGAIGLRVIIWPS
jgi:membrane associated rhomboid family serine protease